VFGQPDVDPPKLIQHEMKQHVPDAKLSNIGVLVVQELERLHEGKVCWRAMDYGHLS